MVAVRVVQVAVNQIIDMIAVRHRLMSTARPMNVLFTMSCASMQRGAPDGVVGWNLDHMLIDMPIVHVVQATIVQVVDMACVADTCMPAARPVNVVVIGVRGVRAACHVFDA
jgi:hypothetical protein